MSNKEQERRKFPRIKDKGVSVQFKFEGLSAITKSLDISASGIYCKITEQIPLMTKLEIVLALPSEHGSSRPTLIDIEGVVVREHPVIQNGRADHYDIAIFFTNLMPKDREKLVKYIDKRSSNN
ncbi:MAG: PilZ domain-containing protein [Candidatus Omnitrophica bacterium]|nr:PilZ domain-containing protein [Candidatus Omnitrophota bacterium]